MNSLILLSQKCLILRNKKAGQQASFSTILHYSIHLTYLAYQDHLVELASTS